MDRKELKMMKKEQLLKLAKKDKISISASAKKDDIITALLSKKENPKAVLKSKAKPKAQLKIEKPKTVKRPALRKKTAKVPLKKSGAIAKIKLKTSNHVGQTIVESTKFQAGSDQKDQEYRKDELSIQHRYGEDTFVLMVRDPWWLFSYWEITLESWNKARAHCATDHKEVLRVYDVTGLESSKKKFNRYFDIELSPFVENWYINVEESGRSYVAEIGLRDSRGVFYPIIRSNVVMTPKYGPSDAVDEEWMVLEEDYWKMFALSGGYGIGKGSEELQEVLKHRMLETISSPGVKPDKK
ncbi:MAG: DUF4912 domain-containing protein [Candidatus Omnitrophica bacterium]|nr:DUF4912 domain-containing protein [Candidatus Omnitrophota bacterium]